EADLIRAGEAVMRVPARLMAAVRRTGRELGKSDPIDALAAARAALREPELPVARLDGETRRLRLLVDHREDLVGERTRMQSLLAMPGCGPLSAAKILGEVAGAARFRSRAAFARWNGTAPIPAWSGNDSRHRLNRGGNRQVNAALHRIALTQWRGVGPGRAY